MNINSKVKKGQAQSLQSFIDKSLSKDDFIDLELLDLMQQITTDTGLEVAVVVNRKGVVEDVYVGQSNSVSITTPQYDTDLLNGRRLIHTHPNGNSNLSALDKSMLTNNRYDAVCAVGVKDGKLTTATVGFINADSEKEKVDLVLVHNPHYINKYGLIEKIKEYNEVLKQKNSGMFSNADQQERAVLVGVELSAEDDIELDLEELASLADTAKVKVVAKLWQKRNKPDVRYLIGQGKLEELQQLVQNTNANLVIVDNELSGSKMSNLSDALGVKVITRSMLILDIFATRAKTKEGKLQVELAQLKYMKPRAGNMTSNYDGGGSGVGLRGPGESKVEINRRVIEKNIIKLNKELQSVKKNREVARQQRKNSDKSIVSLVGYTNSGKSTLMNALAKAHVYEKNELFATLDTTTRNVFLGKNNDMLLIDTVGFINKLPHELIKAFSSTLEESVQADLLLHVVDVSHPHFINQMKVVNSVLEKIGAKAPILTVFNKIDKAKKYKELINNPSYDHVCISAKNGIGLEQLKKLIIKKMAK